MSTVVPDLPAEHPESFLDDLTGMFSFFIDPDGAARRIARKWFWVGPVIVLSILTVISGILLQPIIQHVMEVAPMPPNVNPEQYQKSMAIGMTIQRVFVYLAPITIAILILVQALVIFASSAVMGVKTRFLHLFNLAAGISLISAGLTALANLIILKAKGEIGTMAELRPPLGLDIVLPEGTNKFLIAFVGYFSIFEVWAMVMLVLVYSAGFRVSKGKAFAVILPLILLGLFLRLAGAAFQR